MKWTTDKPTEPGWYWVRDGQQIEMVDLELDSGTLVVYAVDDDHHTVDEYSHWFGPLPQPEPPQ